MLEKILLSIDSLESAKKAAIKIMEIQKKNRSKIVIFYIYKIFHYPLLIYPYYTVHSLSYSLLRAENKVNGKNKMNLISQIFKKQNLEFELNLIMNLDPISYIIKNIEENRFDLFVIGCNQKTILKHFIRRKIIKKILNHTNCDIMIIN